MTEVNTTSNICFVEQQRFLKPWRWLFSVMLIFIGVASIIRHDHIDGKLISSAAVIIISVIVIFVFILLYTMKLKTKIDAQGIYYKYIPLHWQEIRIDWSKLENAYVRKYNPILEYGGWGIRLGIFGKGRAYNVYGNMGMQLVFKDGKKLLLGTQKPDELQNILNELKNNGIFTPSFKQTDRF